LILYYMPDFKCLYIEEYFYRSTISHDRLRGWRSRSWLARHGKEKRAQKIAANDQILFRLGCQQCKQKKSRSLKESRCPYVWPADERTRFFKVLTLKPLGRKRKTKAKGVNK
jgi:hypothetical protein